MANKVKIYSTLKSGKVFFDGARVSSKEIGTLEVEAHPSISNRIRIKSLTQFKRGSSAQYRVFFGKLNINRIQNEAGQNLVADLGMDRDAVIAYISTQITKPIITEYFEYNPVTDRLEANKNIEVNKHGFYVGGKYKMASGNSNLYYEDLATKANSYPVMGEVLDQSLAENQVAGAGFVTPKMRVFGDFQTIPLGGTPVNDTAIPYDGLNFFPFNISGVGITTRVAETVLSTQQLKYEVTIDDVSVYIQYLSHSGFVANDDLTWYFDHPLDIETGTTLRATIYKVSTVDNQEQIDGILDVCEGDATPTRYQTNVMNRFFDDRDLELISPYIKYQSMDFGLDSTGSTILLRDLSLGTDSLLQPHAVNTLEAVAEGTNIRIKIKGGAKVIVESLPVSGISVDGVSVNSVMNQALLQLNNLFTNTDGFASGGGNPVTNFELVSDDLTLTLDDGTSFTVDVTTLGVDTNNFVSSGALVGSDLVLTMTDGSTVTIDAQNMINGSSLSALGQNWFISYGANAGTQLGNPTSGNLSYNNAPIHYGEKLEVGTEFMWTQYHQMNNAAVFMSIGVWAGATNDVTGSLSTLVTNWSTKFGFYYDKLMEDTSTLNNGGYSSKNTDLGGGSGGTGTAYANGSIMRLVYGSDYRLRLYVNDVLTATTIVPESGDDLDIQLVASNNGVEFPNFIKRTTNWTIVHDLDSSENNDILNGIEEDTVLETNFEIEVGEKAMVNLSGFGRSHRIGLDYTGAASGNSNPYSDVEAPIVYGTSEQIIAQNTGEWSFNTSALYYSAVGNGKWSVPSSNAGMVSFRYYNDNSMDLYSETYGEVIATKMTNLDGTPFKVTITANENVSNFNDLPTLSKQVIGQGFQPRTTYAPNVANQSVDATESDTLNYQIVATDYIVNQYVAENAPSWMSINQETGVLSGLVPSYAGDATDTIVVNCKAGNAVGGTTNFIVTINVLEDSYTNTKSLRFQSGSNAYLTGLATNVPALSRAANGAGATDAWTISMWVKTGGSSDTQQLFHYGGNTTYTNGAISLMQQNLNDLVFVYGTGYNNIVFSVSNVLITNTWTHILVTYDGGTTGVASGSLSDYYSRFNCVINGNIQSPSFSQANNGYNGSINAVNYFIGRGIGGVQKLKAARVNQLAIWSSDEFSNRDAIYNSGSTQDLSLLTSAPDNYYEIDNSVTTITDLSGSANLTGFNFVTSDLVTDTP